jgi:hypothetical protein
VLTEQPDHLQDHANSLSGALPLEHFNKTTYIKLIWKPVIDIMPLNSVSILSLLCHVFSIRSANGKMIFYI